MDIELVLQEIEVPSWAEAFARVQEAKNRESTVVSGNILRLLFEKDQPNWSADAESLIEFLDKARIPYDRTDSSEIEGGNLHRTCERKRFTLQRAEGFTEIHTSEAKWTPGEDDEVSLKTLHDYLKENDVPGMVERIKLRAESCGMNMQKLGSVQKPADDLLFTMSVIGNDLNLLQTLATPERVNEPIVGIIFGTRALYESICDNDVTLTAKLIACGARTDEYCSGYRGLTIAEYCLDDDEPENEAVRALIRTARAREHAHNAIESIASATAHSVP